MFSRSRRQADSRRACPSRSAQTIPFRRQANVNGGYAGVQLSGVVTMPYTGTDAPAVGYAALASDGADGVKASTKGNTYLVLSVNTTAKTVSFML